MLSRVWPDVGKTGKVVEHQQNERRGIFLVSATWIANAYLIAFAVDGGVSLADELLKVAGASPLGDIREMVAGIVLLASLAMLLVTIFVPQLPKYVLLPLVFFELWVSFGAPPLTFTDPSTSFALSAAQVALLAIMLVINRFVTGGWLLNAQLLPHKSRLVLRTIISLVVVGLVMPIVGAGLLLYAFGSMIEKQTGGYLQFTSDGIEVRETILRKGNKTVRLIGMVHVGEPGFYEALNNSFPPEGVVLAEGVTDREGKLAGSFSYKGLAEVLGLKVQPQFGHPVDAPAPGGKPTAAAVKPDTVTPGPATTREPMSIPATPGHPRIIYADADVSDFSPTTIRFLGKVGELYGSSSFGELLSRLNEIGQEFTDEDLKGVFDDILNKRNTRVLAEFDKRIGEYDTIVVPWGAQHMPGLEAALRERGFAVESQRMLAIARYQTIIDRLMLLVRKPQSGTSFWYRQKMWIG